MRKEDIVREAVRWSHPADRARRVAVEVPEGIAAAVERGVAPAGGTVGQMVIGRCRDLLV